MSILTVLSVVEPFLNSLGLIVVTAILGFLASWFWWQKKQAENKAADIAKGHQELLDKFNELTVRVAVLDQSVLPINAAYQAHLIKVLTNPHTPEMDALLAKIPGEKMNQGEVDRFATLLKERTTDIEGIPQEQRDAAKILPIVMKLSMHESELIRSLSFVKPVSESVD
jgi:hypothetical protein